MCKLISLLSIFLLALLLGGCLRPVQNAASSASITGNVTYTVRSALPDDAMVTVQLRDADSGSTHGVLINQQQINTNGNQVPIPFEVPYMPAQIDQSHTYELFAFILDGNSKIIFTSEAGVPVLTNGNPVQDVEVIVVPSNDTAAAAGEDPAVAAAAGDPLAGTSWSAFLFNDGASAIVSIQGVPITAEFAAGGQLSGFSGCNNYSATYTVGDGGAITIGPIASTQERLLHW
jgi:putative lipoprotein